MKGLIGVCKSLDPSYYRSHISEVHACELTASYVAYHRVLPTVLPAGAASAVTAVARAAFATALTTDAGALVSGQSTAPVLIAALRHAVNSLAEVDVLLMGLGNIECSELILSVISSNTCCAQ